MSLSKGIKNVLAIASLVGASAASAQPANAQGLSKSPGLMEQGRTGVVRGQENITFLKQGSVLRFVRPGYYEDMGRMAIMTDENGTFYIQVNGLYVRVEEREDGIYALPPQFVTLSNLAHAKNVQGVNGSVVSLTVASDREVSFMPSEWIDATIQLSAPYVEQPYTFPGKLMFTVDPNTGQRSYTCIDISNVPSGIIANGSTANFEGAVVLIVPNMMDAAVGVAVNQEGEGVMQLPDSRADKDQDAMLPIEVSSSIREQWNMSDDRELFSTNPRQMWHLNVQGYYEIIEVRNIVDSSGTVWGLSWNYRDEEDGSGIYWSKYNDVPGLGIYDTVNGRVPQDYTRYTGPAVKVYRPAGDQLIEVPASVYQGLDRNYYIFTTQGMVGVDPVIGMGDSGEEGIVRFVMGDY